MKEGKEGKKYAFGSFQGAIVIKVSHRSFHTFFLAGVDLNEDLQWMTAILSEPPAWIQFVGQLQTVQSLHHPHARNACKEQEFIRLKIVRLKMERLTHLLAVLLSCFADVQ